MIAVCDTPSPDYMTMPVVNSKKTKTTTAGSPRSWRICLPVGNMICFCMQPVVQRSCQRTALGDFDWLSTLRIIWDLSLKYRNRKLDRYHGIICACRCCTMGMSTSTMDDETLAVSKKTRTRHAASRMIRRQVALDLHVHGGPVARDPHDLRQGMMHTDGAGQSDSTLDPIERNAERLQA